ncbi:MAG: CcdB family protein [Pseudomonadota bacterium]
MSRFDVFEFKGAGDFIALDLQADILEHIRTTIIVPLFPLVSAQNEIMPRLKPVLTVLSQQYVMGTENIGSVERTQLGQFITNIEATHRYDIMSVIDFLFDGF